MFQPLSRMLKAVLIFTFVAAVMMLPGTGAVEPVEAASPDLIFSLNFKGEYHTGPSYLDRGGDFGPRYLVGWYGYSYTTNWLSVISRNGFAGDVDLEVLNLPAGITAEMPESVYVERFNSARITIKLRAAPGATLGDVSGVTIRGTAGSIVKTALLPTFEVVDELPPLPN